MTDEEFEVERYKERPFVVVLWRDGKPAELHHFMQPGVSSPGFYRQTTAINSYQTHESNAFYKWLHIDKKPGHPPIRGHLSSLHDKEQDMATFEEVAKNQGRDWTHPHRALPAFHHANIYDFYAAVGYDRKKKRYV